jgi:hypothetical protein
MKWSGSKIDKCQICQRHISDAFVDGKTTYGPWAIMCMTCFDIKGIGLGTGSGQMYKPWINDTWIKVEE